jgi:endonuclease YncB( thermonuclease family)
MTMGWRDRSSAAALAAALALPLGCSCASAQQQSAAPDSSSPCGAGLIAQGAVSHVIDGRTFALTDGREVRLAAIEVPPLPSPQDSDPPPGGAAAKTTLDDLVGSDEIVLHRADIAADRYGRVVAYAYAVRDGDEIFAQGELISAGFARVGDHVGSRACAAELLKREDAARRAKLGLWANPYYDVLDAETPADVLAHRGRFALVEGKVVSVRESGSTLYVNFGRRWSEDFTVTIQKRNERNFAAAGLDLKGLAGRHIRVRGWVERRGTAGGAAIEAARPEQIEAAERE